MFFYRKVPPGLVQPAQHAPLCIAKETALRFGPGCCAAALCLGLGLGSVPASAAVAAPDCDGAQRIRLRTPVALSDAERAELRALAPLRIVAVDTPPMMQYDARLGRYVGIGADVLCFLARQTGLRYAFVTTPAWTVAEKIRQVQDGGVDVFVPLSRLPERERKGLFTVPYYDSHYAAIARKARRLVLGSSADLAQHRVGVVSGVSLEPSLRALVPAARLHSFATSLEEGGLFQALRSGTIDVAVFNQDFFAEKRYSHELFDLEIVRTLTEFPRSYGFYFSTTAQHQRLVAVLDRYLAVIDTSAALEAHTVGERELMERYVAQRSQRSVLLAASIVATLLALAAYAALRRHRRLALRLAASHAQVLAQQQQLQAANSALEHLSQTDGLTGLANRRRFDQALLHAHAHPQRSSAPLSLLMIDVDDFKHANDHYGHALGDDYLRAVARALERGVVRAGALVARYGGEEFVCLLPGTDHASACALAEQLRAGVAALDLPNARAATPYLTVSIGLATLQGGAHSALDLVARADAQLYAAKKAGRNRVCSALLTAAP